MRFQTIIIDEINSKLNGTNKFKYSYQLLYYHKPLQNLRLYAELITLWNLPIESTILKPSDDDDDNNDKKMYRYFYSKSICGWMELAACHPELWGAPTYLTPCSRILLEKLTGSQLVKRFPAFDGTRKFITAFTSACHLSLSSARSIQSCPHIPLPEVPS